MRLSAFFVRVGESNPICELTPRRFAIKLLSHLGWKSLVRRHHYPADVHPLNPLKKYEVPRRAYWKRGMDVRHRPLAYETSELLLLYPAIW